MIALVGVALLTAGLATVYSSLNIDAQVSSAARARLQHSAKHFSDVAAVIYTQNGGFTSEGRTTLTHLADVDTLAVTLVDTTGQVVLTLPPSAPLEPGASATAAVLAGRRKVGQVVVSQSNGQLLTPEELRLRGQLSRTHLIAGGVSAAIALAAALYLALTLSRPLRRIRAGAMAMRRGDLATRVPEAGDEEISAVAQALNSLAETLEQEETLRKESVADLAHELRTPVMGLLARIEAAQDGVFEDRAANLAAMHAEAMRLTRLLDDLSALADAERPELLATHERIDLAELVGKPLLAYDDQFAAKGIELESELRPVFVEGDAKRLEQLVVNLLANALRYTDRGGHVAIRVLPSGHDALIEVSDTGIGIPADDVPHVFTRFWRGERSRSRATGGAGIGLAIVQAVARAHHGSVALESTVGEGSTFRVRLPAA